MEIDLLLPGLFDRLPDWSQSYAPMDPFPVIEKLLAAGAPTTTDTRSFEAAAWRHYDREWNSGTELPSARVLSGIKGGTVFHAEPVHLKAGMSDLLLFEPEPILSRDEKADLTNLINQHFAADDIHYSIDSRGNAYLALPEILHLQTTEPSRAIGHGAFSLMPRGEAAAKLGRLGNEIQMLLHSAAFNQQRSRDGGLEVNGLWLWGCGDSQRPLQARHDLLLSNHSYALACAATAGQTAKALPKTFDTGALPKSSRQLLIVLDQLLPLSQADDIYHWQEMLKHLEQTWFLPLQAALRAGSISRLQLNSCDGRLWRLTPRSHWKLWRRPKPLVEWL